MNCYHYPILRFLLPLIAGILFANSAYSFLIELIIASCILLNIGLFLFKKTKPQLLIVICFNLVLAQVISEKKKENENPIHREKLQGVVKIIDVIKQNEKQCSFTFMHNGNKVLCYLMGPKNDYFPNYKISLTQLTIVPITEQLLQHPEQIEYYKYLQQQNITATAFLKANRIVFIKRGNGFLRGIYVFRRSLIHKIQTSHFLKPREEGVFISLLLGDKSFLEKSSKTSYQEAGVIHVLAISGLHVGIVFYIIQLLLKPLPFLKKNHKAFISILFLFLYACLSGLSPSVLRASLMCILVLLAPVFQTKVIPLNIVYSSAYFLLLLNPLLLRDVGFQLSYSAVVFIIYGMERSKNYLPSENSFINKIRTISLVNTFAFLGTFPLLLYHFKVLYLSSIISGFVVIPIISFVVLLGAIGMCFVTVPFLLKFLIIPCNFILFYLNEIIFYLSENASGKQELHFSSFKTILSYCILFVVFSNFNRVKFKLTVIATLIGLFLLS